MERILASAKSKAVQILRIVPVRQSDKSRDLVQIHRFITLRICETSRAEFTEYRLTLLMVHRMIHYDLQALPLRYTFALYFAISFSAYAGQSSGLCPRSQVRMFELPVKPLQTTNKLRHCLKLSRQTIDDNRRTISLCHLLTIHSTRFLCSGSVSSLGPG